MTAHGVIIAFAHRPGLMPNHRTSPIWGRVFNNTRSGFESFNLLSSVGKIREHATFLHRQLLVLLVQIVSTAIPAQTISLISDIFKLFFCLMLLLFYKLQLNYASRFIRCKSIPKTTVFYWNCHVTRLYKRPI